MKETFLVLCGQNEMFLFSKAIYPRHYGIDIYTGEIIEPIFLPTDIYKLPYNYEISNEGHLYLSKKGSVVLKPKVSKHDLYKCISLHSLDITYFYDYELESLPTNFYFKIR